MLAHEKLIPLSQVPKRLPRRRNGRRIHISSVFRWVQRGVAGRRLEAIRLGGTTYTSLEALARFGELESGNAGQPAKDPPKTPSDVSAKVKSLLDPK